MKFKKNSICLIFNKQRLYRKAQSSIEFTLMVGVAMLFFILILIAVGDIAQGQSSKNDDLAIKSIAVSVVNEISLAYSSADGYERNFLLPSDSDFQVSLIDDFVQVKKGSKSTAYPAAHVTGNLQKGSNNIRKINNSVFIN
jgi:hypothetical protein